MSRRTSKWHLNWWLQNIHFWGMSQESSCSFLFSHFLSHIMVMGPKELDGAHLFVQKTCDKNPEMRKSVKRPLRKDFSGFYPFFCMELDISTRGSVVCFYPCYMWKYNQNFTRRPLYDSYQHCHWLSVVFIAVVSPYEEYCCESWLKIHMREIDKNRIKIQHIRLCTYIIPCRW